MKVRVTYKTINEIEVEVDEKYAECIRLADTPWEQFPFDRLIEWDNDRVKLYRDIECMMPQLDDSFDHIITIMTKNDNPIYES